MNTQFSPLWTDATSLSRMTGTWRSAAPAYRNLPSPCLGACPVGGRIAEWIKQVEDQDYHGAWTTLVDNNPFPAISGRICHHPCESACNRRQLDETVGICSLERFVGDMALAEGWAFVAPETQRPQSVAIVGGGPAGLSAAYQLRRAGVRVSLYDAQDQLGGLLRHGIPAYRLDKAILDAEIARILDMGVTVHLNAEIADAAALISLRARHDAVFLATGASRSKQLPGLDYSQPWVVDSAEFLAATNAGVPCTLGGHVLVIGGGSAALDVARTARRLGRAVTVLSLEPGHLLPAQRVEVDEAKEEGVGYVSGAMLQTVDTGPDGLTLNCVRVDFRPGEARGKFTATPLDGSEFTLTADAIVPAIGQDADLARWQAALDSDGPVLKADANWHTGMDGVFAGGDVASMDRFVTQAVGMGKEAAVAILAHVAPDATGPTRNDAPAIAYEAINTAYHPPAARTRQQTAGIATRLENFDEVQHPLGLKEALAEASRCFSCGTCTFCDNCYFYCPDMAIVKTANGYEVNTDYCKGCGLCVTECPTGSIRMTGELAP
jgi:NADPH-dependent glutamate synthase beta subunit-like oxidoreductase